MTLLRAYLDRVQGGQRLRRALLTLWVPITLATLLPICAIFLSNLSGLAVAWLLAVATLAAIAVIALKTPAFRYDRAEARQLRHNLTEIVSKVRHETILRQANTSYLATNLSTVELAVALHHVFSSPDDKLIWDGLDQATPDSILREWKNETLETTPRAPYFASAISEGLGKAVARDLAGQKGEIVCVLRDGAFSAGMSYEAINNAGAMNSRLIVVLNDSDTAVAPPVSAMSAYFARLFSGTTYLSLREAGKLLARHFPRDVASYFYRAEEYFRGFFIGGTLFEELGFYYVGPIDGHNLDHLLPVLRNVRDTTWGPVLIHVVTQIGKGSGEFKISLQRTHSNEPLPTYSQVFAKSLTQEASKDARIVAVTAGMPMATGVDHFGEAFPKRVFNVGLAEQHAVAFCAGLSTSGYKPFAVIYSTFLQRAYDQIVREVAIRKLPVRFAINGSSLSNGRVEARAGIFDIANLSCLPDFVVMAPSDEAELVHMTATQVLIDDRPSAVRYPHDFCMGVELPVLGSPLEIGKGRIIREGGKVALISLGTRLRECEKAADALSRYGLSTTVADARFAAPLDVELVRYLATHHQVLITVEEGSRGGFGASVMHALAESGIYDVRVRSMFVLDDFSRIAEQKDLLDSSSIVLKVLETLQLDDRRFGYHKDSSEHHTDMKLPYASFAVDETIPNLFWLKAHKPRKR